MKKKIIIIFILIIVAVLIFVGIFLGAFYLIERDKSKITIIGEKIVSPDRIVYRNENGEYFEFLSGGDDYEKILELLENSINDYNENGKKLTDDEIDSIHTKSFIEFDYKTKSKNYIIQLDNNKEAVIKLADTGGTVCVEKIDNLKNIKSTLGDMTKESKAYLFKYKEMISKNVLQTFEYKYEKMFKEVNYKIHQVKIEDYDTYEKFYYICNLALEEEITEQTFDDNVVIITVSSVPKIDVKVNIGNIKYTYNKIENASYQYNVHVLVVSKIVNTDCVYNNDLTEIETKVQINDMNLEQDENVDNLDSDIFMKDFNKFISEYTNANTSISKSEAESIVDIGFEQTGYTDKNTQTVEEQAVKPTNLFIRKANEYDMVYQLEVEAYVFTRTDDMGNGVEIYVDKRLGKIIGGRYFGD